MDTHDSYCASEFIELLLNLISSDRGEIAMATTYLLQAATETDPLRKTALNRIARKKARHIDVLGVMLVSVYRHPKKSLEQLHTELLLEVLADHGLSTTPLKTLVKRLESPRTSRKTSSSFSSIPRKFLISNIAAEDYQIAIYSRMLQLTPNPIFLYALKIARSQLIRYRKELIDMLEHA